MRCSVRACVHTCAKEGGGGVAHVMSPPDACAHVVRHLVQMHVCRALYATTSTFAHLPTNPPTNHPLTHTHTHTRARARAHTHTHLNDSAFAIGWMSPLRMAGAIHASPSVTTSATAELFFARGSLSSCARAKRHVLATALSTGSPVCSAGHTLR